MNIDEIANTLAETKGISTQEFLESRIRDLYLGKIDQTIFFELEDAYKAGEVLIQRSTELTIGSEFEPYLLFAKDLNEIINKYGFRLSYVQEVYSRNKIDEDSAFYLSLIDENLPELRGKDLEKESKTDIKLVTPGIAIATLDNITMDSSQDNLTMREMLDQVKLAYDELKQTYIER
ncbi:MAG: hypothetical protein ACMXYG_03160 [Candidatus Woesearchaeota archaeon]